MTKKKNPADLKKTQQTKAPFKADPPKKVAAKEIVKVKQDAETKATVTVTTPKPKPSPAQAKKEAGFRIDLLDNWMGLNAEVKSMGEDECKALIDHERSTRCRPNVILRLHGRYNKIRGLRERTEFMQPAK